MKTVVIYHRADFDCIFCREIAKKFLPHAELIGWDYGDPVPTPEVVSSDDELYMLDISIDGLMGHPKLTWIDHHKSAIEKFTSQLAPTAKAYTIDGVAACRLAWHYFVCQKGGWNTYEVLASKKDFVDRTVYEPWAVRLAGEYDIWDKRDTDAELFQHGLRSRELTSKDWQFMWLPKRDTQYEFDLVRDLLNNGKVLQYARTQENESIIKAAGFTIEFEGLKFLACNHARYNSHLFAAGLKPEHDGCFGFCWRDCQWVVSLYHAPGKEHHDLSQIAVKYGGGGHRGACGFRTKNLPFIA
jgi:uncharacterized protein